MSKKSFIIGSEDRQNKIPAVSRQVAVGLDEPLFLIAGPCVIESRNICMEIADRLIEISDKVKMPVVFKASFDKANRSSVDSFRGPGIEAGLKILAEVRERTGLAVLTDVHQTDQPAVAAGVVDCFQIPAFLCRQTDLLCACAETGKPVNVKKGQFLCPAEMQNVVDKISSCGNEKIMLTERGTFFGYNNLVNDMTAIDSMKKLGCPVIFDGTHSSQQPGGLGNASGGRREMAPLLAKAAVAAGANGLFLEVHPKPQDAKSDAACIMPLDWLEDLLKTCKDIFEIVRE